MRDPDRDREITALDDHDFSIRDLAQFNAHEFATWRTGNWQHRSYNWPVGGRYDVHGVGHPYAAPAFPHPAEFDRLIGTQSDRKRGVEPALIAIGVGSLPGGLQTESYCDYPPGFYPMVGICYDAWITVP